MNKQEKQNLNHAFLILCHSNFKQLKKLLNFLDRKESTIIIGVDGKVFSKELSTELQNSISNAIIEIRECYINWGGYSQIESTLQLLALATRYDIDYLHFLTGTDIPMMSWNYFQNFIKQHNGMQFIQFAPENYEFAKWKCDYRHFFVENRFYRKSLFLKAFSHILVKIQMILGISRRNNDLRHGSAYFSITKEWAMKILKEKETIRRQYRYSLAADEVWIQTYAYKNISIDEMFCFEKPCGNGRYIDWKRREGSSPYTFHIEDAKELGNIINTCYMFSRKFDENVDWEIIDWVYNQIENR